MDYSNIRMIPSTYSDVRYALIKDGKNPLIVIEFNPSTANDTVPDNTMKSVMRIAATNKYDGFIMLNVYPLRSTCPDNLPKNENEDIHKENIRIITEIINKYPNSDILVAFGNLVFKREYTLTYSNNILNLLKSQQRKILCIDTLKSGMPKHPLYAKAKSILKLY